MIPLVDLKAQYNKIKPEINKAIKKILDNTSFIMGEPVKSFEKNLAKFCKCKYAISVSSGSSALFLALKAYGIKKGDEVITVPNSFIATAEAIVQCDAKPVFVDVKEDTMLIDIEKIEKKITKKTKAIIPVHLYGQICDMDPIIKLAKKYKLAIIEDAAQAIDSEYKKRKLPVSNTAIFSFFPAKNLGCYGDGGAVVIKNKTIADKVSKLRDHGRISKYESDVIGYGERLDALQAAILDVKLKYLKSWTKQRRKNAYFYNKLLKNIKQITLPKERRHSKHVYYMYELRAEKRNELIKFLKSKNIASGIHYPIPLHLQGSLAFLKHKEGDFPVAEKVAKEIISLPMYPELNKKQIKFICEQINKFYRVL
jgi:dTDP-4-amino-4,6-dideoxygalactose transaminase